MTNPSKKGTGYGFPKVTIGKAPEYKGDKYNIHDELKSKERKAHIKAMAAVKGQPFRAAAPDLPKGTRGFFDGNPMRQAPLGKAKPNDKGKNVTVPFYPNKPLGTMGSGGNNFATFTKMTYTSEKAQGRKPIKKKEGCVAETRSRDTRTLCSALHHASVGVGAYLPALPAPPSPPYVALLCCAVLRVARAC